MANIQNRKAHFDYYIEEKYEAGLVLQGWEVKSIREGRLEKSKKQKCFAKCIKTR